MNEALGKIHADSQLANFIEASRTPLRIACHTDNGFPLIVPLWFQFDGHAFWCVTHKNARLLRHLRARPEVGFEIANNEPPYAGARGYGRVELLPEQGAEWLPRLLARYAINAQSQLGSWLLARADEEVAIRLVPEYINGWDYRERMHDAREF